VLKYVEMVGRDILTIVESSAPMNVTREISMSRWRCLSLSSRTRVPPAGFGMIDGLFRKGLNDTVSSGGPDREG